MTCIVSRCIQARLRRYLGTHCQCAKLPGQAMRQPSVGQPQSRGLKVPDARASTTLAHALGQIHSFVYPPTVSEDEPSVVRTGPLPQIAFMEIHGPVAQYRNASPVVAVFQNAASRQLVGVETGTTALRDGKSTRDISVHSSWTGQIITPLLGRNLRQTRSRIIM